MIQDHVCDILTEFGYSRKTHSIHSLDKKVVYIHAIRTTRHQHLYFYPDFLFIYSTNSDEFHISDDAKTVKMFYSDPDFAPKLHTFLIENKP